MFISQHAPPKQCKTKRPSDCACTLCGQPVLQTICHVRLLLNVHTYVPSLPAHQSEQYTHCVKEIPISRTHAKIGAGVSKRGPHSAVVVPKAYVVDPSRPTSKRDDDGGRNSELGAASPERLNTFKTFNDATSFIKKSEELQRKVYHGRASHEEAAPPPTHTTRFAAGTRGEHADSGNNKGERSEGATSMCLIGSTKGSAAQSLATGSDEAMCQIGSKGASAGDQSGMPSSLGSDAASFAAAELSGIRGSHFTPPCVASASTQTDPKLTGGSRRGDDLDSTAGRNGPLMPESWKKGDALGSGSFGTVYLGLNNNTGEVVQQTKRAPLSSLVVLIRGP